MAISVTRVGQKVTIRVVRQLVGADHDDLQRLVSEQLAQEAVEFIIDFADAGYIDSRGLGGLVAVSKRIREQRGGLCLVNLNPDLRQLFALTSLDHLFDFGPGGGGPRVA